MTTKDFNQLLLSDDLPHIMLFVGNEQALKNIYVQKVIDKLKLPTKKILQIGGFFRAKTLFIISADKEVEIPDIGQSYAIFLIDELSEKSNLFKNNTVVLFDKPSESEVLLHINKLSGLNRQNSEDLYSLCGGQFDLIYLEIDKLLTYSKSMDLPINEAYQHLRPTIYAQPKDAIFDFVAAVMTKNKKLAYSYLDDCKQIGENSIAILKVLYNNVKSTLQVQTASGNIEQQTGLSKGQIYHITKRLKVFTNDELISLMQTIHKLDLMLKQGLIESEIVIEYLLGVVFE